MKYFSSIFLRKGLVAALFLFTQISCPAAEIRYEDLGSSRGYIRVSGEFQDGDSAILAELLQSCSDAGLRITHVILDGSGKAYISAMEMASYVKSLDAIVMIPKSKNCSGACFVMFAASPVRTAWPDATVQITGSECRMLLSHGVLLPDAVKNAAKDLPDNEAYLLTPQNLRDFSTYSDSMGNDVSIVSESRRTLR